MHGRSFQQAERRTFDVVAIGNAVVDVISHADDSFLMRHGMVKGTMRLVPDEATAEALYAEMGPAVEISGGSAANTVVGVASLGGRAAFIGRVADDQLGEVFTHDIRAAGVEYRTPPVRGAGSTGRCLVLVTPDAQRTMNTYLGVSNQLQADDLDEELIREAQVLYCEGYLWDLPDAKDALVHAMKVAEAAGARVAFTLSDPFCVDRHREELLELVEGPVDILFANEAEICSLYGVPDVQAAAEKVAGVCEIACLTMSERGVPGGGRGESGARGGDARRSGGRHHWSR
ncbi:MAG: hypothetical protein KatS3mg008_1872 [Acidimicrobiales bacterium]|nr:MAG: hypothetical protein KatS3mg008_1872 [Acidimicrobiales bacterium]